MDHILNDDGLKTLKLLKNIATKRKNIQISLNYSLYSLDAILTISGIIDNSDYNDLSFPVLKDNYWLCHLSLLHQLNSIQNLENLLYILAKRHFTLGINDNPEIIAHELYEKFINLPKIPQFQVFKTLIKYFDNYLLQLDIPLTHDYMIMQVLVQFLLISEDDELLGTKLPKPQEFILDLICSWRSDFYDSTTWEMGYKTIHTNITGIHKIVTIIDSFVYAMKDKSTSFDSIFNPDLFVKYSSDTDYSKKHVLVLLLYFVAKYYSLPINRARDLSHLRTLHKLPWLTGLNICINDTIMNKHMLYFYHSALFECLPEFFTLSYDFNIQNIHSQPLELEKLYSDMTNLCNKIYVNGLFIDTHELHQIISSEPLASVSCAIDFMIQRFISKDNLDDNYIGLCQNPMNLLQRMKETSICTFFSIGLNDYLSKGLPQSNNKLSYVIRQNISQHNVYYLQECAITAFLADLSAKHIRDKCTRCKNIGFKMGNLINGLSITGISNTISFGFDQTLISDCVITSPGPEKLLEITMQILAKKIKSIGQCSVSGISSIVFCFKIAVALVLVVDGHKCLITTCDKDESKKYLLYCAETLNIYFLESLKTALTMSLPHNSFVVSAAGPISRIYYKFPKLAPIASVVITHHIPSVPLDQEMLLKALNDLSLSLSAIIQANATSLL